MLHPEENFIIVREVSASKAHVTAFGTTRKRFAAAPERANETLLLRVKVQDRYKRLQDWFEKGDAVNWKLSGVGGGRMDELLLMMREERGDFRHAADIRESRSKAVDDAKELAGVQLIAAAFKRK